MSEMTSAVKSKPAASTTRGEVHEKPVETVAHVSIVSVIRYVMKLIF